MSDHSDEVAAAVQTLRSLNEQADGVRAELVRLRRELAEAQQDLSAKGSAKLVEANEHLVLAALDAQTMAETAVIDLDKLARSSQRDPLTDTPNRALMLDRLENAIALARRHGTRIGVLFLDLDDFKPINDTLGHAVGDAVLQLVARRLESVVRHSDTVSRHSGDEFLVLLAEVSQESGAGMVAAKILSALAAPSRVGEHVLRLSASVGIALYPDDGEDAATLINRADEAMYRAKRCEHGSFEFYTEEISSNRSLEPSTVDVKTVT
ncbi:MAG: GGDEF domain-containing protein [Gammaproteobacteria bacterium]|nr:GGDEF domain-containing protein [Gammaproteobacteria bacterium]